MTVVNRTIANILGRKEYIHCEGVKTGPPELTDNYLRHSDVVAATVSHRSSIAIAHYRAFLP